MWFSPSFSQSSLVTSSFGKNTQLEASQPAAASILYLQPMLYANIKLLLGLFFSLTNLTEWTQLSNNLSFRERYFGTWFLQCSRWQEHKQTYCKLSVLHSLLKPETAVWHTPASWLPLLRGWLTFRLILLGKLYTLHIIYKHVCPQFVYSYTYIYSQM